MNVKFVSVAIYSDHRNSVVLFFSSTFNIVVGPFGKLHTASSIPVHSPDTPTHTACWLYLSQYVVQSVCCYSNLWSAGRWWFFFIQYHSYHIAQVEDGRKEDSTAGEIPDRDDDDDIICESPSSPPAHHQQIEFIFPPARRAQPIISSTHCAICIDNISMELCETKPQFIWDSTWCPAALCVFIASSIVAICFVVCLVPAYSLTGRLLSSSSVSCLSPHSIQRTYNLNWSHWLFVAPNIMFTTHSRAL